MLGPGAEPGDAHHASQRAGESGEAAGCFHDSMSASGDPPVTALALYRPEPLPSFIRGRMRSLFHSAFYFCLASELLSLVNGSLIVFCFVFLVPRKCFWNISQNVD